MRKASIDLGTNTALLLVAEVEGGAVRSVLHDESTMVRLGRGVDRSGRIDPDSAERTLECLRGYSKKSEELGVKPSDVVCVATATARDAENGADFFSKVTRETGLVFRTISGEEEARSMFLGGLLPGMDRSRSAVIDIGGGSTEFRSENRGLSLRMGSVRFTERYLKSDPVTDPEFWSAQASADSLLSEAKEWRNSLSEGTELVAVAGTAVTLARIHLGLESFDSGKIDGLELSRGDVHLLVEDLKWRNVSERKSVPGLESGRADVILGGALILWRSMEVLGFPRLRVSTRGLRYGVILG